MRIIDKDRRDEGQPGGLCHGKKLAIKTGKYTEGRERITRTMSVGNNHSGQELDAERRISDRHDTPLITLL